jgi:hypothetical protein
LKQRPEEKDKFMAAFLKDVFHEVKAPPPKSEDVSIFLGFDLLHSKSSKSKWRRRKRLRKKGLSS